LLDFCHEVEGEAFALKDNKASILSPGTLTILFCNTIPMQTSAAGCMIPLQTDGHIK
jgi:hypothetical protein